MVIAAGGDGTVNEVAQGLAGSEVALGVMPLGSVMNVARTLHIPRDLGEAAALIAEGQTLDMDLGRATAAPAAPTSWRPPGWGWTRASSATSIASEGPRAAGAARGLELRPRAGPAPAAAGDRRPARTGWAPMITVANSPFLGAAYAIAPEAVIDDGWLDVVLFHRLSALHVLVYLVLVAGGRPFPAPGGGVPACQTDRRAHRSPVPSGPR